MITGTLLADAAPRFRPAGVRVMAIVCFALAGYLVVNGLLIMAGVLSLASGAYIVGEYSTMGPALFLGVAVSLALLGIGLLRGWRWARRLAVIASALLIATAVMPISAAVIYFRMGGILVHGAKIIAAIVAIRYLVQPEVVDWFGQKSAPDKM